MIFSGQAVTSQQASKHKLWLMAAGGLESVWKENAHLNLHICIRQSGNSSNM